MVAQVVLHFYCCATNFVIPKVSVKLFSQPRLRETVLFTDNIKCGVTGKICCDCGMLKVGDISKHSQRYFGFLTLEILTSVYFELSHVLSVSRVEYEFSDFYSHARVITVIS